MQSQWIPAGENMFFRNVNHVCEQHIDQVISSGEIIAIQYPT